MIKRVKSRVINTTGGSGLGSSKDSVADNRQVSSAQVAQTSAAKHKVASLKAKNASSRFDGQMHINKLADEAVVDFFSGENSSRARNFILRQLSKYFELDIVPVGMIIDIFV